MKKLFKIMTVVILAAMGSMFCACTDATWDSMVGKLGVPANVTCYSGTKSIFEGRSTGAVKSPKNSDGYQFRRVSDGKFVEVSGNYVIVYDD